MRRLKNKLLVLFSLISFTISAQSFTSNCNADPLTEAIYRNDIFDLAIKRVQQIQSNWKDSVIIPAIYRDSIAKALYAIHNMQPSPLKDTIMDLFGFSNFSGFNYEADSLHGLHISQSLKNIYVQMGPGTAWDNDWQAGNYNNTSNNIVNGLINRYNLSVQFLYSLLGRNWYKTTSPYAVNSVALANLFVNAGSQISYPIGYYGDGNRIIAEFNANGIKLTYSNGCGDCPAGCTVRINWIFQVYTNTDCHVEFLQRVPPGNFAVFPQEPQVPCLRYSGILPLHLLSFSGVERNGFHILKWMVEDDMETDHYVVEHSENGNVFSAKEKVKTISGPGLKNYLWQGTTGLKNNYYRLRAVNRDGSFFYSNIILLTKNSVENKLQIFPNPVENKILNIQLPLSRQHATIRIISSTGQVIYNSGVFTNGQTQKLTLPVTVNAGYYLVVLENKEGFISRGILIR